VLVDDDPCEPDEPDESDEPVEVLDVADELEVGVDEACDVLVLDPRESVR
jgi:hypothetical protein